MNWRAPIGWVALAALGACAAIDGWRWFEAARINRSIADGSIADEDLARDPAALFAQACFLAARGQDERALNFYKRVQDGGGALARAALYNTGNVHLRRALELHKARGEGAAAALITPAELAKQAYRDVLRADAGDWDARFNLERALRLLPDPDDDTGGPTPGHSERAATTMRSTPLGLP
jgi:mxaK protein